MRNQKGITLIALVITIIVLLILAGVTISLTLGRNGALSRARNAVSANELGTASEELNLACSEAQMAFMDAWMGNQNIDSMNYYANYSTAGNTYSSNCQKAKSVALLQKEGNVKGSDRTLYVRYLSPSAVYYYFTVTVTADDAFKIDGGVSENDLTDAQKTEFKVNDESAYSYAKGTLEADKEARKDNSSTTTNMDGLNTSTV